MRSLKECYEIVKKYHSYWARGYGHYRFMCLAVSEACFRGNLSYEELCMLKKDIWTLVHAIDPLAPSLLVALGNPPDEEVKAYWDKHIDNLENQDGYSALPSESKSTQNYTLQEAQCNTENCGKGSSSETSEG